MSKKKTTPIAARPSSPAKATTPVTKTANQSAIRHKKDAQDARKFFLVLGIGTILLVIFLYFIFVAR